jgi:hypothetical protein
MVSNKGYIGLITYIGKLLKRCNMFLNRKYIGLFTYICKLLEPMIRFSGWGTNQFERSIRLGNNENQRQNDEIESWVHDQTVNLCNNYRNRECQINSLNLPDVLSQIIYDYDIPGMEQRNINIFENHSYRLDDLNCSSENIPIQVELRICKNVICAMITLDNGLVVSGSFYGMIQIWNPLTGRCLKKIDALEISFTQSSDRDHKRTNPQILEINQISDELIAITSHCVHFGASSRINIINIFTGDLQVLYDHGKPRVRHTHRIQSDYFVSIADDRVNQWYIADDQKVNFFQTKILSVGDRSRVLMYSESSVLILSEITNDNHIITSINIRLNTESHYLLEQKETIICHWFADGYFFAKLGGSRTRLTTRVIVLQITDDSIDYITTLSNHPSIRNYDCDKREITHIVHIVDDLIAVVIKSKGRWPGEIKILAIDNNFYCVKIFNIGDEGIRAVPRYANGFITVNYFSEIKVYDFI